MKDKFGGFQADPPPEVWEAISDQLGGRRRRGMILIILSAAASLALAVTLGIHYFGRDIPHTIEWSEDQKSDLHTGYRQNDPTEESGVVLEQKVVEAMAEAIPARDNEAILPAEVKKARQAYAEKDRSEKDRVGKESAAKESAGKERVGQERVGQGGVGRKVETLIDSEAAPGTSGVMAEAAARPEAAAMPEAAAGDEKVLDLILDAGEVGDVEMMADVVTMQDKDPRWVLGAMLSPLYSFRDAEPEALAGTSGQESGLLSYATGVQVGYRASRRLAIESGIIYNKMGLSIGAPGIQVFTQDDLEYSWSPPDIGASTVNAITNSVGNIVSYKGEIYVNNYKLNAVADNIVVDNVITELNNADQGIRQHLDYLELPFNLRYTVLDGSFKIQLVGGLSTNLLVNNYVTMETASGTTEIGYLTNLRNLNYSGNAGVGFAYHFLEQLSLNVEPRFRYYLNSVNDATLPSTRPFTFGIYTGLNYFF